LRSVWTAGELYAIALIAKAIFCRGEGLTCKRPIFVLQFSTMLLFPSAKINLGLRVTAKRSDGFHNIESIFYPVPLYDVVEFRVASENKLTIFGKPVPGKLSENLLGKTWKLLYRYYKIPPVEISLLKNIPAGSGLGGGSADATFFLKGLNDFFQLNITVGKLMDFAAQLGSDCPFFVRNRPAFVTGRGEIIQSCNLNLSNLFLVLVIPGLPLSTRTLFQRIVPKTSEISMQELVNRPVNRWQRQLSNDFEKIVFQDYPSLAKAKEELISRGALYASMSGTGSTLYGLFKTNPETETLNRYGKIYKYKL